MKKNACIIISFIVFSLFLMSCSENSVSVAERTDIEKAANTVEEVEAYERVEAIEPVEEMQSEMSEEENHSEEFDVDLTLLSSTMVYSEVYNMMTESDDYIGKSVKMQGAFSVYQNEVTGQLYFACIVSDATACCAQGIEFELEGDYSYPEDYPEIGKNIEVSGIFETYEEDGYYYCRLKDAKMNPVL